MTFILRCVDRWGRTIALTHERWYEHVVTRRPYFQGFEDVCVRITLEQPDFVVHDVSYENRENFYRVSPLPQPYTSVWVKVVVEFDAEGGGEVITVYLTDRKKPGERQKWP